MATGPKRGIHEVVVYLVPACISLTVLVSVLFVILPTGYGEDIQKWASSIVGTVIGYWLRPVK